MQIAGWLLDTSGPSGASLFRGYIDIRLGSITEVGEGTPILPSDLGDDDCIVMPGFVDAHLHLPQFDSIGIGGLTLLEWLDRAIFPAEARWADVAFASSMTRRVVRQLLGFGTTSFAAYATVHHASAQAAIDTASEFGVRAAIGQVLMDRRAPADLVRPAPQLLKEAASLRPRGRVAPAITPRFAVSCTPELLEGAGRLASSSKSLVQTHLAETQEECALIGELFEGDCYVNVYEKAGLLTKRTILGHGIWLDDTDRALLARRHSAIAHCPAANDFLGAGSMNRAALLDAGVKVALGSDVAGGPDRSMVRVARAMLETARRRSDPPPTPADCWRQITATNAQVLRFEDVGSLAVGKSADVLVIKPDIPIDCTRSDQALSTLLYAWDDRWIEAVIVQGRMVGP